MINSQVKDLRGILNNLSTEVSIDSLKKILITNLIYNLLFHWKEIAENFNISCADNSQICMSNKKFKLHQEFTYPKVAEHVNKLSLQPSTIKLLTPFQSTYTNEVKSYPS